MILLLGCLLGLGLLLGFSPFLWPAGGAGSQSQQSRSVVSKVVGVIRERMSQAGLRHVSIATLAAVCVIFGCAGAAITLLIVPVAALSCGVGVVALALPAVTVAWRARAARRAGRVIWPDIVDHLVSTVRSGLALPDCVASLARGGPPQTREAFVEFERDYLATGSFGRSLDRLKSRLADPTADRILETLRMSREVGGSELPSVLRSLASYLRQESAIRGEVEAKQSWVMNAAKLGAIAPWIVLALLSTRPEAATAYNTPAGVTLIVGGLLVTVVAYRLMVAIARLPEERRWFS